MRGNALDNFLEDRDVETQKRVYVGLLVGSMFVVALLAVVTWYLLQNRDIILSKILLISIISILGAIFIILGIGIMAIIIMIIRSKSIPSLDSVTPVSYTHLTLPTNREV